MPHPTRSIAPALVAVVAIASLSGCRLLETGRLPTTEVTRARGPDQIAAAEMLVSAKNAYSRGHVQKAERLLREALIAAPGYAPAHNNLGRLLFEKGDLHSAAWEFDRAAQLSPNEAEPLLNLGLLLESVSLYDEAIMYYREALALSPEDPATIGSLCRALIARDQDVEDLEGLLRELLILSKSERWRRWAETQLATKPWLLAADEHRSDANYLEPHDTSFKETITPPHSATGPELLPSPADFPTIELPEYNQTEEVAEELSPL